MINAQQARTIAFFSSENKEKFSTWIFREIEDKALRGERSFTIDKTAFLYSFGFRTFRLSEEIEEIEFRIAYQELKGQLTNQGFKIRYLEKNELTKEDKIVINW